MDRPTEGKYINESRKSLDIQKSAYGMAEKHGEGFVIVQTDPYGNVTGEG